jgi:hypothetical protein
VVFDYSTFNNLQDTLKQQIEFKKRLKSEEKMAEY